MGIKSLRPFLKKYIPDHFEPIKIEILSGHKIAIDFDILIFEMYKVTYKNILEYLNPFFEEPDEKKLIKQLVKLICDHLAKRYMNYDITPIIICSGISPPEKDLYARERRKKVEKSQKDKLEVHGNKYREKSKNGYKDLNPEIFEEHRDLKYQIARPSHDLIKKVATILEEKGYTVLHAVYEAEELCAALCLEDKVQAVYSTDTDNIVRRCPITITEFEDKDDSTYAHVMRYSDELPKALGLTYRQFVDMCIMMECDYNKKIYGVGNAKILPLLLEHKSIEGIGENTKHDINVLNYKRCREIFNLNHKRKSRECCSDIDKYMFIAES